MLAANGARGGDEQGQPESMPLPISIAAVPRHFEIRWPDWPGHVNVAGLSALLAAPQLESFVLLGSCPSEAWCACAMVLGLAGPKGLQALRLDMEPKGEKPRRLMIEDLNDQGAVLAEAVSSLRGLRRLELGAKGLADEGVVSLAFAIGSHPTLEAVHLRGDFGAPTVAALQCALDCNPQLVELTLRDLNGKRVLGSRHLTSVARLRGERRDAWRAIDLLILQSGSPALQLVVAAMTEQGFRRSLLAYFAPSPKVLR